MSTAWGRGLAGAFFAILLCLVAASPAEAHATVVNSNPTEGARLAKLPNQISLTFDENVGSPAFVSVTAPDGTNLAVGDPQLLDATVTQPIKSSDLSGKYQIAYRVVSADSHPVTGFVSFRIFGTGHVATAEPTNSAAGVTTAKQVTAEPFLDNTDLVFLVLVMIGLVGAGLLSAFRRSGQTEATEPQSEETVGTK